MGSFSEFLDSASLVSAAILDTVTSPVRNLYEDQKDTAPLTGWLVEAQRSRDEGRPFDPAKEAKGVTGGLSRIGEAAEQTLDHYFGLVAWVPWIVGAVLLVYALPHLKAAARSIRK